MIDEERLDELIEALIDAAEDYFEALIAGGGASAEYNARGEARAALVQYVTKNSG